MIKNVIRSIKQEPVIYGVVLISVIVACFVMNFAYGIFRSNEINALDDAEYLKVIYVKVPKSDQVTARQVLGALMLMDNSTVNEMEGIFIRGTIDGTRYEFTFTMNDKEFYVNQALLDNYSNNGMPIVSQGRYFTDEEYGSGAMYCIGGMDCGDLRDDWDDTLTTSLMTSDTTLEIDGKEYKIIGWTKESIAGEPMVPITSVNQDNVIVDRVDFFYKNGVSRTQFQDINNCLKKEIPNLSLLPELRVPDVENKKKAGSMMLLAVLVAFVSSMTIGVLYDYILTKRRKELAIYRLCGMSKKKAIRRDVRECLLFTVPSYLVGALVYDRIFVGILDHHFHYLSFSYDIFLFVKLFLIFLIVNWIVIRVLVYLSVSDKVVGDLED